jgi:hypothetical protein
MRRRRGGRVAVVPLSSYPAARPRYFLGWFAGRLFCACFDDVNLDLGDAFAGDAQRFGGGRRDVHDAAANERAAVVDAHRHRASRIDVGDAQPRPERQCAVGGGQFVLVELLAARGVRVVAVEARKPVARAFRTGGRFLARCRATVLRAPSCTAGRLLVITGGCCAQAASAAAVSAAASNRSATGMPEDETLRGRQQKRCAPLPARQMLLMEDTFVLPPPMSDPYWGCKPWPDDGQIRGRDEISSGCG